MWNFDFLAVQAGGERLSKWLSDPKTFKTTGIQLDARSDICIGLSQCSDETNLYHKTKRELVFSFGARQTHGRK
jgi:hypothetical protein